MAHNANARGFLSLSIARAFGVALSAIISIMMAHALGAGVASDAFFMVRRICAGLQMAVERAFLLMYVPAIVEALRAAGVAALEIIMLRTMLRLMILGVVLAAIVALAAPWIVSLLAPGFDRDRAVLAASILRVFSFVVAASTLVSLATSLLNALRRFAVPELVGQLPRLAIIVALWIWVPRFGVQALTWSLLFGTALAVTALIPSMLRSIRRDGEALVTKLRATAQPERSSERASPDHRIRAGRRLLPMLVAQIHMQGAIWIDVAFASTFGVGFLSILEYGQRLTNMAPSILSNSLLSISYTELSHKAVEHKAAELNRETAWTFRTQLFLTLPVGLFLGTTAELIVSILLHRGAFSADAAQATTEVIRWLVPALVVNTMASTLNAAVFADPMLPHLKIFSAAAVAGLISRILLFVMLCGPMGINAIPFGTALSMAILSLVLLVSITRYRGRIFRAEDLWSVAGICFCGAVSSIVMLGVKRWLGTGLEASLTVELGALTIIGIAGAGSYLATAYLMKQHELGVLGMTPRRAA